MDDQEFQVLLGRYAAKTIGYSEITKIPWGILTNTQYQQLLSKVPESGQSRVQDLRAKNWNPNAFTSEDGAQFTINVFDDPERAQRTYEVNDPEYYYKYFYQEASESADWKTIAEVYNLLFDKNPKIRLKNGLDYAKARAGSKTTYTFRSPAGADTWRTALTKLMLLGFEGVPCEVGASMHPSLATAILDSKFVEQIACKLDNWMGSNEIRIFWRCDGRDKARFLDARTAEASVDLADRADELNLSQSWNPFSEDKIKKVQWMRKASKDNDYYTIVSVALDFRTSSAFPTLDEAKNPDYQFPVLDAKTVKPLKDWTASDLAKHKKNLALVLVTEGGKSVRKIRICTKTYAYMAVIHNGYVINTQAYGGSGANPFPEKAVRSLPVDSVVGYLPFYRVHHGGARADGFTTFMDPNDKSRLLVDEKTLQSRYGLLGRSKIIGEYVDASMSIIGRLRSAWASGGHADPSNTVKVTGIIQRPLAENVLPTDPRLL